MYHIIVNPASRSGRGLRIWKKQVEPVLIREKVSFRSYLSEKPGNVIRIAKGLSESAENNTTLQIIVLG